MIEYSAQVKNMCPITKGPHHGPAPIPEEGEWVKAYKIEDISGYTHGVGWCAPEQGVVNRHRVEPAAIGGAACFQSGQPYLGEAAAEQVEVHPLPGIVQMHRGKQHMELGQIVLVQCGQKGNGVHSFLLSGER